MMKVREYRCENGHIMEKFTNKTEPRIICPICKEFSNLRISAPHIDMRRMGIDPHGNPTACEKWARMQTQKAKRATERMNRE